MFSRPLSTFSDLPQNPRYFPLTRWLVKRLIRRFEATFTTFRNIGETLRLGARFIASRQVKLSHVCSQAAFVGVDTLSIALILTTFSAMVIALQVSNELARQGVANMIGAMMAAMLLRELAPIMTAVGVIAMAGSAFSAELATMQITKQVDALTVFKVHPVRFLVLPRVLGTTLAMPLMTVITTFSGIMGGLVVSTWLANIHPGVYLDSVWNQVQTKDIFTALLKSSVFGFLIALLATTIGLSVKGGAREVGTATTKAVVWSFLAVAIFDYLISYLML